MLVLYGKELLRFGYAVVPIGAGVKWPHIPAWQNAVATDRLIDQWASNHTGVGILGGHTVGVDIDTREAEATQDMLNFVRERLGSAPFRVGQSPKALLPYRCEVPFAGFKSAAFIDERGQKHQVEIIAKGQQFVASHVHPDTRRPYQWHYPDKRLADSLELPHDELPPLIEDDARAIVAEFERLAQARGWQRSGKPSEAPSKSPAPSPKRREAGTFFDQVNDRAMAELGAWVPLLFPAARDYQGGFRVTSTDLGRELEEDLSLVPEGIKDFGVHDQGDERDGKRSPIDIVLEWAPQVLDDPLEIADAADAALWLCTQLLVDPASLGWKGKTSGRPTFGDVQSFIDSHSLTDSPQDLASQVIDMLASAELPQVELELALAALKNATGVRKKALEQDLARARARGHGADGATHHDYAKEFVDALAKESGGVAPVGVEGQIYLPNPSAVWKGRAAGEYEADTARLFSGRDRACTRGDYLSIANHVYALVRDERFFDDAPMGLACPAGFYRIGLGGEITLAKFTAEHRQRFVVGISPQAGPTPRFDKFLKDTFATARDGEAVDQIELVQEIMGAVLFGLMAQYEKAVLFKGEGRAGKGTLLKVIEHLVPAEWRAASSPFRWDSEYYLAALAGKRLNVVGELPDDVHIPAAHFKTVTGRDLLTGRHPTGRPFTFRNEAAHIFNSNHFINTRDRSEAFYSRWIIVEFPNSRLGGGEQGTDTTLAASIIELELPAILHWAAEGARRLTLRGAFQATRAHDRLLGQWRQATDSLMAFLTDEEWCELGPQHRTKRADLYSTYKSWCGVAERMPLSKGRWRLSLEGPLGQRMGLEAPRKIGGEFVIVGVKAVDQDAL